MDLQQDIAHTIAAKQIQQESQYCYEINTVSQNWGMQSFMIRLRPKNKKNLDNNMENRRRAWCKGN